jgi:hypothetical protein
VNGDSTPLPGVLDPVADLPVPPDGSSRASAGTDDRRHVDDRARENVPLPRQFQAGVFLAMDSPPATRGPSLSLVDERLRAAQLRRVATRQTARYVVEVTLAASSRRQSVFGAEVILNQAQVTIRLIDRRSMAITWEGASPLRTNTLQDEQAGQIRAATESLVGIVDDLVEALKRQGD